MRHKVDGSEHCIDRDDLVQRSELFCDRCDRTSLTFDGEENIPVVARGIPVEDRRDSDNAAVDKVADAYRDGLLGEVGDRNHGPSVHPTVAHEQVNDPQVRVVELRLRTWPEGHLAGELHWLSSVPRRT